jgi:hypothetical protein
MKLSTRVKHAKRIKYTKHIKHSDILNMEEVNDIRLNENTVNFRIN